MNTERSFLHDIASPVTSVLLNLENIVAILQDNKPEEIEECIKMANSCVTQLKRTTEMIRERREILIKESEQK
jgi:hypothetical protein